jgi:hypothetical protein
MLDSLVFFLILWVALMPDRLGYDDVGEGGGSRRSKPAGTLLLLLHLLRTKKLE